LDNQIVCFDMVCAHGFDCASTATAAFQAARTIRLSVCLQTNLFSGMLCACGVMQCDCSRINRYLSSCSYDTWTVAIFWDHLGHWRLPFPGLLFSVCVFLPRKKADKTATSELSRQPCVQAVVGLDVKSEPWLLPFHPAPAPSPLRAHVRFFHADAVHVCRKCTARSSFWLRLHLSRAAAVPNADLIAWRPCAAVAVNAKFQPVSPRQIIVVGGFHPNS
jgi:hypothetical protein